MSQIFGHCMIHVQKFLTSHKYTTSQQWHVLIVIILITSSEKVLKIIMINARLNVMRKNIVNVLVETSMDQWEKKNACENNNV